MRNTHWLSLAAMLALAACTGKEKGGEAPGSTAAPKSSAPATEPPPPATQAAPATEAPAPGSEGTAAAPGSEGAAPGSAAAGGDATAEAKQIFQTRCTPCHGAEGKGDGAAAQSLPVKPRNYTDKEWQKNTPDDAIAKIIVEGGAAVGKSPLMPPNPDLKDKPEVVKGLVQIIRDFGK
jgi:mono/diheme cytochrome c family protein